MAATERQDIHVGELKATREDLSAPHWLPGVRALQSMLTLVCDLEVFEAQRIPSKFCPIRAPPEACSPRSPYHEEVAVPSLTLAEEDHELKSLVVFPLLKFLGFVHGPSLQVRGKHHHSGLVLVEVRKYELGMVGLRQVPTVGSAQGWSSSQSPGCSQLRQGALFVEDLPKVPPFLL